MNQVSKPLFTMKILPKTTKTNFIFKDRFTSWYLKIKKKTNLSIWRHLYSQGKIVSFGFKDVCGKV